MESRRNDNQPIKDHKDAEQDFFSCILNVDSDSLQQYNAGE